MKLGLCNGTIKLSKKFLAEGMDNRCHRMATQVCETCGKAYCHNHIHADKHECGK